MQVAEEAEHVHSTFIMFLGGCSPPVRPRKDNPQKFASEDLEVRAQPVSSNQWYHLLILGADLLQEWAAGKDDMTGAWSSGLTSELLYSGS